MTIECNLTTTYYPLSPEESIHAFIESYEKTSKISYYQKYQKEIEEYFNKKAEENIKRSGLHDTLDLMGSFHAEIDSNGMKFYSISHSAAYYEYGYSQNGDLTAPSYFMRPAFEETSKFAAGKIIDSAIQEYNSHSKGVISSNISMNSNYLNKYNGMKI